MSNKLVINMLLQLKKVWKIEFFACKKKRSSGIVTWQINYDVITSVSTVILDNFKRSLLITEVNYLVTDDSSKADWHRRSSLNDWSPGSDRGCLQRRVAITDVYSFGGRQTVKVFVSDASKRARRGRQTVAMASCRPLVARTPSGDLCVPQTERTTATKTLFVCFWL